MYTTLIDPTTLQQNITNLNWVIIDCRFSLDDPGYGAHAYEKAHIPRAVYAHLDQVLSNPPSTDNGRHPLPPDSIMARRFGELGITNESQVVVYDDNNGLIAARLWWMLRYLDHTAVAVLDGGWQAWQAEGYSFRTGIENNEAVQFSGQAQKEWLVLADDVPSSSILVDSRAPDRFRGENETIDPIAGHIPGAINFYYQNNWGEDGRYLAAAELRRQFESLLGANSAGETVFYCGSGVSACVNLLAIAHAGLGNGRLYAGSWSDWITNSARPIETGGGSGAP